MSIAGAPIEGDNMGIGLCLLCVLEHRGQLAARTEDKKAPAPRPPRFAITWAPMPYPVPTPAGGVAGIAGVTVPVCYDHSPQPGGQPKRSLLVAAGGMP